LFSRDHRPTEANWQQEEAVDEVKPFDIPKREVWEAFKNERVDLHRELLRSTTDPAEIERINRLIAELHPDRVRLHKNPER
jgi:hypothetical protein